jgi:hypothetical protein
MMKNLKPQIVVRHVAQAKKTVGFAEIAPDVSIAT